MTISTRRAVFPAITALLLAGALSAFAHARLLRSNPPDKAQLEKAPEQVEFWFNELLDEGFNSLDIYPAEALNTPAHTNFARGTPVVQRTDRTHLSAAIDPLPPGKYIVDYRVLSRDGHTGPGRITFTVLGSK